MINKASFSQFQRNITRKRPPMAGCIQRHQQLYYQSGNSEYIFTLLSLSIIRCPVIRQAKSHESCRVNQVIRRDMRITQRKDKSIKLPSIGWGWKSVYHYAGLFKTRPTIIALPRLFPLLPVAAHPVRIPAIIAYKLKILPRNMPGYDGINSIAETSSKFFLFLP